MRLIGVLFLLAALASCTGSQPGERGRGAANERDREGPKVKTEFVDPERLARDMAATNMAYAANKERKERVFGTALEDVWWQAPSAKMIRRISTGDVFQTYDYNGGYPSFFVLKHGGESLRGEYKTLSVDAHPYEPIVLIGPPRVYGQPDRPWTAEELKLIASFFQTRKVEMRKANIASMRVNGHGDMANAQERAPMPKVSVVVDTHGLISKSSSE